MGAGGDEWRYYGTVLRMRTHMLGFGRASADEPWRFNGEPRCGPEQPKTDVSNYTVRTRDG